MSAEPLIAGPHLTATAIRIMQAKRDSDLNAAFENLTGVWVYAGICALLPVYIDLYTAKYFNV